MRRTISVHIGQAGVRSGCTMWDLFSQEHGIQADGKIYQNGNDNSFYSYFNERENNLFSPRCLLVDLDGSSIKESTKKYSNFDPVSIVGGKSDTGGLFSDGYCLRNSEAETVMDHFRKLVEQSSLSEIHVHRSLRGGTGSGFGSVIQERISVDYGKKFACDINFIPFGLTAFSPVEPYNVIFSIAHRICDATVLFDNEALYENSLLHQLSATWNDMNYLHNQTMNHLTYGDRYQENNFMRLEELCYNVVYPRLTYFVPSFAPGNTADLTSGDLLRSLFDPSNFLVKRRQREGLYMKVVFMLRGHGIHNKDLSTAIASIKNENLAPFVSWAATGFKLAVGSKPALLKGPHKDSPRSGVMLADVSSTRKVIEKQLMMFDKMYARRAFVHWFVGAGMCEDEFKEAKEEVLAVLGEFKDVETEPNDE